LRIAAKPRKAGLREGIVTREEQKSITSFIELAVKPVTVAQKAPFDVEADAIIRALFVRNPEAAYRMTLLAMAQAEELARIRTELDEERKCFRQNWLARLLKKPDKLRRGHRRDPRLSLLPQNLRGR
jgi:enoyl-CoA hydratase/carnithine racemase